MERRTIGDQEFLLVPIKPDEKPQQALARAMQEAMRETNLREFECQNETCKLPDRKFMSHRKKDYCGVNCATAAWRRRQQEMGLKRIRGTWYLPDGTPVRDIRQWRKGAPVRVEDTT